MLVLKKNTNLFRRSDYCLRLQRGQRHLPDCKVRLCRGLWGRRGGVVQVDRRCEGMVLEIWRRCKQGGSFEYGDENIKQGREVQGVMGGRWSGLHTGCFYDTHNDTPTPLFGTRATLKKVNIAACGVGNLTSLFYKAKVLIKCIMNVW